MVVSSSPRRKGVNRALKKMSSVCEAPETMCGGEELLRKHSSRSVWWITIAIAVLFVILIIPLTMKMQNDFNAGTGSFTALYSNSLISPSATSLGFLVGILILYDAYTTYMICMHKGHLDNSPIRYSFATLIRLACFVFFMYGVAYGATIGSTIALVTLCGLIGWQIVTSYTYSPFYVYLQVFELAAVIFLLVWLQLTGAVMLPTW
jgi:hypothetical protein